MNLKEPPVPRKYSMDARSAAVEETRRRIIDATVQLHNQQGIKGTSMQDIADRAEVALATVYRHFPSLDELVPACGGRILELNPPPTADVFDGLDSGEARIAGLVQALHDNYARGSRVYEVGFAEAATIPALARFMDEVASNIAGLVATAAAPFKVDGQSLDLARGLCDFRVWLALTEAGLNQEDATKAIARIICTFLSGEEGSNEERGKA